MNKKIIIWIILLILTVLFYDLIAQSANSNLEVPGVANLTNKITAISQALSGNIFRGITVLVILSILACAYFNMIKWKWILIVTVVSILVNVLSTLVDFIFSA